MGTQGLITLVDGAGEVVAKLIAGCNGGAAHETADALRTTWPHDLAQLHAQALHMGFGCHACLVVMGPEGEVGATQELPERYRTTFQMYHFNPRWSSGTAEHTAVRVVGVHPHRHTPLDGCEWQIVIKLIELGNRRALSRIASYTEVFWLDMIVFGLARASVHAMQVAANKLEIAERALRADDRLLFERPIFTPQEWLVLVDAVRAGAPHETIGEPSARQWSAYYAAKLRTVALELGA